MMIDDLPVLPDSYHAATRRKWDLTWNFLFRPSAACTRWINLMLPVTERAAFERQFGRHCEERTIHHPNVRTAIRFHAKGYTR